MAYPALVYATPRKLPRSSSLDGRVVVLDIAFAANAGGASFEKVTLPFIEGLGSRLAMWVDHHDHDEQARYKNDARFVLSTKAEHGACPEMVTPELVARAGKIDTICCHVDFDGLCSAAKWIRGGEEPYPGADDDARAIDTRLGRPSERGRLVDRALRGRPHDDALKGLIIRYWVEGGTDTAILATIREAAQMVETLEREAQKLAANFEIKDGVAFCDAAGREGRYEKTELLLMGQELASISVVADANSVTAAARFDSGIDLVAALGLNGGMPTRVSVSANRLADVLDILWRLKKD